MSRRVKSGGIVWTIVLVFALGVFGSSLNRQSEPATSRNVVNAEPPAQTSLLSAPKQERFPPRTLYVTATSLKVRAEPNTSSSVLLSASNGTPVIAVGQVTGWYEVRLNNGSTGWMSAEFLSHAAPQKVVSSPSPPVAAQPAYDRNAVVMALISESQRSYPGNCPCPENRMRNGRRCGGNSAWSKRGGYAPLCYASDVTQRMIDEYVARQ
ncbi:MAG: SH3 domain-containing protein [Devosia sp.]|nr:SH3 domain-containing protein [Devosia sp.]